MKKLIIGTALAAVLASGVAMAQPGGGRGPGGPDFDRTITRTELTAKLDERFAKLDVNKDGKITPEERKAQRDARQDERFKAMDKDGNGQLSLSEFKAAHEERRERFAERRADGPDGKGPGKRFGGWHRGPHGGPGGPGPFGGHGRDGNKDGVVTKAEFMAPALAMFDKVDANKDGSVTKEERQAAREAMKKQWQDRRGPPPASPQS